MKKEIVYTGFSGVGLSGWHKRDPVAEIQAMKTDKDGKIYLIFIYFDIDHFFELGYSPDAEMPEFEVHARYVDSNDSSENKPVWMQRITGVKLTGYTNTDRGGNYNCVRLEDVCEGYLYEGTYEDYEHDRIIGTWKEIMNEAPQRYRT